jgi:hypothetical protein
MLKKMHRMINSKIFYHVQNKQPLGPIGVGCRHVKTHSIFVKKNVPVIQGS